MAVALDDRGGTEPLVASASRRSLRRLVRNRLAVVGAVIVVGIAFAAVAAPILDHASPAATNFNLALAPPSLLHPFGTDTLGRDILVRVLYGGRTSLTAGLASVLLAMLVGVPLGLIAGYVGGWVNEVIMRVTDAMLAFPALVLALAIGAMLGPGLGNAIIAIALVTVPAFVRITRSRVIAVRELDFVDAARAAGGRTGRVLMAHILPNVLNPLLVLAALNVGFAILTEASLSFLGVGVQPPTPDWGFDLKAGSDYLQNAPWLSLFPGAAIFLTVLGFNLLGDGLRDFLDPTMR